MSPVLPTSVSMKSKYLAIIIDGYNFLKTTGMMADNVEGIELEKGRKRLLSFLASQFPHHPSVEAHDSKGGKNDKRITNDQKKIASSVPKLTVVFDSQTKLRLPTRLSYKGIDVRFSKGYENADELMIEMIQSFDVPKRLLVVSSDHEIQTAAKRRRAHPIDSDVWLDQLEANSKNESDSEAVGKAVLKKPIPSSTDTEHWLSVFSDIDFDENELLDDDVIADELAKQTVDPSQATNRSNSEETNPSRQHDPARPDPGLDVEKLDLEGFDDIFPPGYGEDLL